MRTKIVYTLVCGEYDVYLAQAAISAYTLRKNNPSAVIELVVDPYTYDVIKLKPDLLRDFSRIVVVETPSELNKVQKSRFLKTTLRKNVTGDYIFIDTDTVIADDLSIIDDTNAIVAAVLDRHAGIENHSYKDKIEKAIAIHKLSLQELNGEYFNSGVMYVKDTPLAYDFYERWYRYWNEAQKKGQNIDQPALARANKELGYIIKELDGTWNCQMVENFINYLNQGKILHYFASDKQSPYKLYDNELMMKIVVEGVISEELKEKLNNVKSLFREQHLLIYDYDLKLIRSNTRFFFFYHRKLFGVLEFIIYTYLKLIKRL